MSTQTGDPVFEFVSGNEVRGGQPIIVHATFKKWDVLVRRYVEDNDSQITAMLVSNPAHKKPAYRTLVAQCTARGRGGEYTLTIPGNVLIPQMLPYLFSEASPSLVVTQGDVGRWVQLMKWRGA